MNLSTIALAFLVSVSTATATNAADVTLKVLYQANHPEIFKPLADAFTASQNSITVELIPGDGNYEGIMQALVRSRIANDVPDVSFLGFDFMRMTSETKVGAPIDSFIEADSDMAGAGYLKNMTDTCVHNKKRLGMPFAISLPVVLYNQDLLQKAGVDTSSLTFTWDEIAEIAKKVDALDDDTRGIFYTYDASGNWTLKALIESAGGSMMNADDTEITFDNEVGQWAFGVLNKIGNSGFFNVSRNQARQSFSAGKLGILVESSSGLNNYIENTKGFFDMRVGPFPVPSPAGRLPAGGNCVVMTTHDPARQAAAWEFIKFVTSAEGQTILANNSGYVPNNNKALEGNSEIAKRFTVDPDYKVVTDELRYAGPSYAFPGKNSTRITRLIEEYMRRVLINEIEPSQALSQMRAEVEDLL
ncbi:extracellular solute-binding protein [Rhizobium laguerreae]|uniref:extracellular solute-binding protein n=1 Tax=Rhizobium laguerreae TaxID=1076926 RepID=UPI00103FE4DE|nr:extracellular solute-binding protein [Rhizobium laguerreae]TBX99044.1 extracellular solute-binding protein [Rhizobium laguerreae]